MFWAFFCIVLFRYGSLGAVHLPPEIQRCSLSDPEFNSCMAKSMTQAIKSFKEGSKDFALPVLDPLEIQKLEIEAEPGKTTTINQKYENVKMYGLIDSKVVKFSRNPDNTSCQWEMEVHTPMSRMNSDYSLTGQVLVFPINGHGKGNVTLYNIVNQHKVDCEHYTKKGKLYERLKNYKMNMTVKKCVFQFENLFPGNEQISKELGKTLNENSLEIFQEVKHGFEEVLAKLHENVANSVLSRMSLDELFLP